MNSSPSPSQSPSTAPLSGGAKAPAPHHRPAPPSLTGSTSTRSRHAFGGGRSGNGTGGSGSGGGAVGRESRDLDADGLPFIDLTDIIKVNEHITGRHILRRRQHAFTRIPKTYWSMPLTQFTTTQELTDEFCGAHEIARCDLAVITDATETIKTFLQRRSRLRETMHHFARSLRIVKDALRRYVHRRRELLARLMQHWTESEKAERDRHRQELARKFKERRQLRHQTLAMLSTRTPLLSDEESDTFTLVLVSDEEKLNIIKQLLRRAMSVFHRRMTNWRIANARKVEVVRRRCLLNFGSILSLPLMLYRARIPDQPAYTFTATYSDFTKEHQRRVDEREKKELATFRAELDAETARTRSLLNDIIEQEAEKIRQRSKIRHSLREHDESLNSGDGSRSGSEAKWSEVESMWRSRACRAAAPHDWLDGCVRAPPRPPHLVGGSASGGGSGLQRLKKSVKRMRLERRVTQMRLDARRNSLSASVDDPGALSVSPAMLPLLPSPQAAAGAGGDTPMAPPPRLDIGGSDDVAGGGGGTFALTATNAFTPKAAQADHRLYQKATIAASAAAPVAPVSALRRALARKAGDGDANVGGDGANAFDPELTIDLSRLKDEELAALPAELRLRGLRNAIDDFVGRPRRALTAPSLAKARAAEASEWLASWQLGHALPVLEPPVNGREGLIVPVFFGPKLQRRHNREGAAEVSTSRSRRVPPPPSRIGPKNAVEFPELAASRNRNAGKAFAPRPTRSTVSPSPSPSRAKASTARPAHHH